jgi:SAM-dependent methyltransferase
VDPRLEESLLRAEEEHYWFRGRRRTLRRLIGDLPLPPEPEILDVGCGGGRFLLDLAAVGRVSGTEPSPMSFEVARRRGVGEVIQAPIEALPFEPDSFDLLTCLDVIEHVEDDVGGFSAMLRVARPGALLVVTVPAYPWLWSEHDVLNHHFRRYRRRTLVAAAEQAGWQLVQSTYFNFLLLAPAAVYRLLESIGADRLRPASRAVLTETPRLLSRALEQPLRLEATLMAAGVRIPAGLSLLGVFRAPAGT